MKKMKKLSGFLLAVVMMMAMTVTVFAADADSTEKGKITITNAEAGAVYKVYKIFDVTYAGNAYAYTIKNDSEWYNVVNGYSGILLSQDTTGKNSVVEKRDAFSISDFVKTLRANVEGKTSVASKTVSADETSVVFENLDLGYYFVTTTTGAICNLVTTNPEVSIADKNDVPFDQKITQISGELSAASMSVQMGDIISYKITGRIPDTSLFSSYTYKMVVTMSEGFTLDTGSIKLVSGNTNARSNTGFDGNDYKLTVAQEGNTFEIEIKVSNLQEQKGQEFTVTYSAKVNAKAAGRVSTSTAELTYSRDPFNASDLGKIKAEDTIYSARIMIDNQDESDTNTKLAGAKFVLKDKDGKFYQYDADTNRVSWVSDQTNATEVTTDQNGAAEFRGLKDGTYRLAETEAPKGYKMLTAEIRVTIDGSTATTEDASTLNVKAVIKNQQGALLPSTGGSGTRNFYAFGGVLILGAVMIFLTKSRMRVK